MILFIALALWLMIPIGIIVLISAANRVNQQELDEFEELYAQISAEEIRRKIKEQKHLKLVREEKKWTNQR